MIEPGQMPRLGAGRRLDCSPWAYAIRRAPGVRAVIGGDRTLAELLRLGKLDAALLAPGSLAALPEGATILQAGCVACPGEAVTDRVLARVALDNVRRLWACGKKTDDAPRLVLQCLWGDIHGRTPEVVAGGCIETAPTDADGVLWTGACGPTPRGYRYSVDLGRMWHEVTGLPLVWAVWVARPGADVASLETLLREARRGFPALVAEIADSVAAASGWPAERLRRILAEMRSYELGVDELDAVHELLFRGREAGLLPHGEDVHMAARPSWP